LNDTAVPDYNARCLQSVISHSWKMSPSNLLVIVLILAGVPPEISTYGRGGFLLPGMCYPDLWSCLRYAVFEPVRWLVSS